jgi:hypothetical protein
LRSIRATRHFFACWSSGQQLPRRRIATLDQRRKLQLSYEAFFRRLGSSRRYETIHFFLHGVTFAPPLLKNGRCHQIPLPTQPERWNLATLDGAGKAPLIAGNRAAAKTPRIDGTDKT